MSLKLIEEKPIGMAELKEEIKKIKKRDEELGLRTSRTEDYLNRTVKIKLKDANELKKKLEDLKISRLKEEHILKLIDLLPGRIEEVKVVMQGYPINLKNEDCKKIAETIKPYAVKK